MYTLLNGTLLQAFVTYLTALYMCTLCDSTNINRIIEFVPNCSMSAVIVSMAVLIRKLRSKRWNAQLLHTALHKRELWEFLDPSQVYCLWQVVKTPTIISNDPVFMCFVFIWEQTATCATYSINWLVFITEMKSIYSAVRTGYLNKAVCASSVKG